MKIEVKSGGKVYNAVIKSPTLENIDAIAETHLKFFDKAEALDKKYAKLKEKGEQKGNLDLVRFNLGYERETDLLIAERDIALAKIVLEFEEELPEGFWMQADIWQLQKAFGFFRTPDAGGGEQSRMDSNAPGS